MNINEPAKFLKIEFVMLVAHPGRKLKNYSSLNPFLPINFDQILRISFCHAKHDIFIKNFRV